MASTNSSRAISGTKSSGTASSGDAPSSGSRTERINLRATREEVQLLRQAATASGLTLTAFIMSTAQREATLMLG